MCNQKYDPQDLELLRWENMDKLIRKMRAVCNKMPLHLKNAWNNIKLYVQQGSSVIMAQ